MLTTSKAGITLEAPCHMLLSFLLRNLARFRSCGRLHNHKYLGALYIALHKPFPCSLGTVPEECRAKGYQ